ncbi:LapA family protein [Nocardioides sp. URHA0020]|uniref:LapA family protein n=1 Tax=Nocardioides sp. URHA0020 TaxID=1380392 RepID=UPI00048EB8C0|nr:LapA family protein [Nocardioides sp. URHA0020]
MADPTPTPTDPTPIDPTPVDPTPPTTPGPPPRETKDPLRRSRTSGAFVGVVLLGLLLLLLIVFIAQNTQTVRVSFLAWEGTTPLAVALLIATVSGILLTAAAGLLRIWQLRRRVKHS